MPTAANHRGAHHPATRADHARPTFSQMLGEVVDLSAGLGIVLLPVLLTALPGVVLFLVLPGVLLLVLAAAPLALLGPIVAVPYLLARSLRRRRSRAP